jgi:hypothetical protein
MRTALKRYASMALFLCVLGCGLALAGEALTDPNSLVFETKDEALRWANYGRDDAGGGGRRPMWVAVMPINESLFLYRSLEPPLGLPFLGDFIRDYQGSKAQMEFLQPVLRDQPADSRGFVAADEGPAARPRQVFLYAMSPDDAKAMARAYLAHANAQYFRAVEDKRRFIQQNSDIVQRGPKRRAELEETHKRNTAEFEELKTKITYRDPGQVGAVMSDLDRAILACTIEITGIRTKLEWVTNYMHNAVKGVNLPESVKPRLDSMFIEESIALKAAEARLKTATDLLTLTQRYADLMKALWQVPAEKEKLEDQIRQAGENISQAQKDLAGLIPPAVPGGKVFLHKLRPAGAQ